MAIPRQKRNHILSMIALVMMAIMLSAMPASATPHHNADQQAAQQSTPTPTNSERPDVVVWWPAEMTPATDSPAAAILQGQFDGFVQDTSQTLLVRTKRLEGTGGIMSTLRTARPVAPNVLPDIVLLPRENLQFAADTGLIFPLDEILPADFDLDLYPLAAQLGEIGSSTYGITYALTVQHTAYAAESFEEVPETFQTILNAEQPFVFAAGTEHGVNDTLLIQYITAGGTTRTDNGRPTLDEAPLLSVLAFYEEASEAGVVDESLLDFTQSADYWGQVILGNHALVQTDSSSYLTLKQEAAITGATVPTLGGNPLSTIDGWLWAITTTDPVRQAHALDFITWMMRASAQSDFTMAYHTLPSQWSALRVTDQPEAYIALIESLLDQEQLIVRDEIDTIVASALQRAFEAVLTGEKTASEATADALTAFE